MTKQVRAVIVMVAMMIGAAWATRASAQPADGSNAAGSAVAAPATAAPAAPASGDDIHAICVKALNADPKLALQVVDAVNQDTKQQNLDAADHIAKNERHVIGAYAAMWIVSAAFLMFLWARQRALRTEIDRLRRDLAAATADDKAGA